VAEVPAAVTDTHPLLFHASGLWGRKGVAARAHFRACEAREALTYVPVAVLWECSLLARAGRIHLGRSVRDFFEDLFSNPAYQPCDLTPEQVYLAAEYPKETDPFDALVCAAAHSLGLPLLTRDEEIRASGLVRVIW
jgi:PIN domain nuclease of toxin-antitoxin system